MRLDRAEARDVDPVEVIKPHLVVVAAFGSDGGQYLRA
jgi:hypothetical protein